MAKHPKLELNTEYPGPTEEALARKMAEQLRKSVEQRFLQGMTYRGVNTKSHAAVRAKLVVNPDLPPDLRVGLYREPRTYSAWVRFCSTLPDPLPDIKPDLRGLSIKLMEVPGEKLLPSDPQGTTHDLTFITPDTFFVRTPEEFSAFAAAGGLTAHKTLAEFLKTTLFLITHPVTTLTILRSQKRIGSLLEVSWNSATPYLFGNRAAKLSLAPLQPATTPIPHKPGSNYLREDLITQLADHEIRFTLRVQFQLDPVKQPIEDALAPWREEDSHWHNLATLILPVQQIDSPEQLMFCENLSMNPWRCLAEHRPLGGVNRVRRHIYYEGSKHRHYKNAVPVHEPTSDQP